jgi:hypothetical protein
MKKIISLVLIILGIALVTAFAGSRVLATQPEKVNVCHQTSSENNPWVAQRINANELQSHLDNGDFLYAGPVKQNGQPTNDGDEWCEEHAPQPPVDVCPNDEGIQTDEKDCTLPPVDVCPNDEGIQTDEKECTPPVVDACPDLEGVQESTRECPPTVGEQPKVEEHHDSPSSPGAPTCGDSKPGEVANIYVDAGVANDGKLEVRWLPKEPVGSKAHIRYSEVDGEWRYSLLNTDNDGHEEIGELQNGTHYWFQVAQVNGCAVGDYSRSFDPTP